MSTKKEASLIGTSLVFFSSINVQTIPRDHPQGAMHRRGFQRRQEEEGEFYNCLRNDKKEIIIAHSEVPMMVQGRKQSTRKEHEAGERKSNEVGPEFLRMELQKALSEAKTHVGLVPICSHCRKIRDNKGLWWHVGATLQHSADPRFTHGICPDCARQFYPNQPLIK